MAAWLARNARDVRTISVLRNKGDREAPALIKLRFFDHPVVVRCGTTDVWTVWDLLYDGEYTPLRPLPRRIVVDCGANIGMYLLSVLKEAPGEMQRYVAAEPDEANFRLLEQQVGLCGVRDKAVLRKVAIFDRDTTLQFDNSGARHWGHRLSSSGGKSVQAVSLRSLLDSQQIDECDLLKVDIEGAERNLFASIDEWKHRVRAIVCELHDGLTYQWFASVMSAAGFAPFDAGALFRRLPGAIRVDCI
jgi:FkbM family methyltransferase